MIKNNTFANNKMCCAFVQLMVTGGLIVPHGVHSSNCHTPVTMCEVQAAISEALSRFAPSPASPNWAQISMGVNSITNIIPSPILIGIPTYNYTVTNTIIGIGSNFVGSIVITCTPVPTYRIYNGAAYSSSSAVAATFATGNPGVSCPLGTASCGTPANITLTLTTANAPVTVIDTNYNKNFTSTNTGWNAYVTGYYRCSYTDPNLGILVSTIVPWGQGS